MRKSKCRKRDRVSMVGQRERRMRKSKCRKRDRVTVERDRECGWQDRENVGERVTVERERERECVWKLIER